MLEEGFTSQLIGRNSYKTVTVRIYSTFLANYPELFSDLVKASVFDFAIYHSLESYDKGAPYDIFNVYCNGKGIEIKPGKAEDSDLELALSVEAVQQLIQTKDKEQYAQLLGSFFNEPDEEKGWIDFILHKRTQLLIDMGYGKFAQTAGILSDDDDIYTI